MNWKEATYADRFGFILEHVVRGGETYPIAAALAGTTKNAISGFVFHNRKLLWADDPKPVDKPYAGLNKKTGPHMSSGPIFHSESQFTEKYEDRRKRKHAHTNNPSDVLLGRQREEWVWPTEKRDRFREMWNAGINVKIIMVELGIGSKSAVSAAVDTLGLKHRQKKGERRIEFKARLSQEEINHLRRRAMDTGQSTSQYMQRLVRLDMGRK